MRKYRTQYYDLGDLAIPNELMKCEEVLNDFGNWNSYKSVDQIIELYNVKRYIDSGVRLQRWTDEVYLLYQEQAKAIFGVIGRFFSTIDPSEYAELYNETDVLYKDEFWNLFGETKQYKKFDDTSFEKMIFETDAPLRCVLGQKETVAKFGVVIRKYILKDVRNTEFLVSSFLEKREKTKQDYFLPKELTDSDKEILVQKYIDLPQPNMNYLELIAQEDNPDKLRLSDRTKFNAYKRLEKMRSEFLTSHRAIETTMGVSFRPMDGTGEIRYDISEPLKPLIEYDTVWLENNLDYATILQNFYWFEVVDLKSRCNLVSNESDLGIFDTVFGLHGRKEYAAGQSFEIKNSFALLQIRGYYEFLKRHGIELESVYQWFFEVYLKEEFGIDGYVYDETSSNAKFGERNKLIVSKIDHVLKQFSLYCADLRIDREYLEFSSQQTNFSTVPSFVENKYAYCNDVKLKNEMYYLFSSQSMLTYLERLGKGYDSLFEMISKEKVYYNDFNEIQRVRIEYLLQRGAIIKSSDEIILLNKERLEILIQIYKKDFLCMAYENTESEPLNTLIVQKELRFEKTLFSVPEQKYFNYLLNKAEFSNGLDLRNKYAHSTNSLDERTQYQDYLRLLLIMVIIIIKINEEFILKNEHELQEKGGSV